VNALSLNNYSVDLFTTPLTCPRCWDGATIGFVAAARLGCQVYGVLVHQWPTAKSGHRRFCGGNIDQTMQAGGDVRVVRHAWLVVVICPARPPGSGHRSRSWPTGRCVLPVWPLISAIGVSFFLQDAIRLTESLTTGQFHRIFPTFGNFEQRLMITNFSLGGSEIPLGIQIKSLIVIIAAVVVG
jgi:branched-chain amino acid transport system permease protein